MKTPLVSICCITYNHEPYIKDTLNGFLSQKTTFPFEIVISDDCSKDNTHKIITNYIRKYPDLFRDVSPSRNMGSFANFTYVQEQAKGKYIAFCEGDDYWTDPLKLQKQIDILEANDKLIACCTNHSTVDSHGHLLVSRNEKIVKDNIQGQYNLRDFFNDNHQYPTLTVVFRTDNKEAVLEKLKYVKNQFLGDWILWICLLIYGDMYYLDEVTAAYRVNPTSLTHTVNRVARAKASANICRRVADVLQDRYADIAENLRDTRWTWIPLMFAYRAEKKYIRMVGCAFMALVLCPGSLWNTFKSVMNKRKNK